MCSTQKNKACNATFLLAKQKRCLAVLIGLAIATNTFSQKEIFFDKTPEDSVRVKRLHGFDVGYYNALNPKYIFNKNPDNFSVFERNELQLNYWHEIGLGAFSSLILKAGANIDRYRYYYYVPQTITMVDDIGPFSYTVYNSKMTYKFACGFHFTAEPRWYLGFKKRFYSNKALLNQGWYLSLPIEIVGATHYTSFDRNNTQVFNLHTYITPTLGYRKAVNKHLFIEGTIGYLLDPFSSYSASPSVASSIKIGYAF